MFDHLFLTVFVCGGGGFCFKKFLLQLAVLDSCALCSVLITNEFNHQELEPGTYTKMHLNETEKARGEMFEGNVAVSGGSSNVRTQKTAKSKNPTSHITHRASPKTKNQKH